MMNNERGSESHSILGVIPPGNKATGAYNTGYMPLKNFARLLAVVSVGTLGTLATVDAKLTIYTDATGSNPLDVTGAAVTQITKANTDDNKMSLLDINIGRLPHALPYAFARLTLTVGTAASDASALVMGIDARYESAAVLNLAAVKEIVSV